MFVCFYIYICECNIFINFFCLAARLHTRMHIYTRGRALMITHIRTHTCMRGKPYNVIIFCIHFVYIVIYKYAFIIINSTNNYNKYFLYLNLQSMYILWSRYFSSNSFLNCVYSVYFFWSLSIDS